MYKGYIVLNENEDLASTSEVQDVPDPVLFSKNMSRLMKRLRGENMMDDNSIDYAQLVRSDIFKIEYAQMSNDLKKVDLDLLLNEDETVNDHNLLAFFINVYNALAIHAIAHLKGDKDSDINGSLTSQLGGKFWQLMAYQIGKEGHIFSMDDIENGILRANRVHIQRGSHQFDKSDPRKKFATKKVDSRIHFALNCGALSCPPISFYTLENLERGLDLAAQNYITNETSVDVAKKTVEISKLLLWYREDFVNNLGHTSDALNFAKKALHFSIISSNLTPLKWMTSIKKDDQVLIEYVYKYIRESDDKKKQLQELVESDKGDIKIIYKPYNFDINNKK